MKMLVTGCVLVVMVLGWMPGVGVAQELRVWTAADGRTIEAELKEYTEKEVRVMRKADLKIVTIPLEKLSEEDQAYVRSLLMGESRAKGLKEGPYAAMITGEFVRSKTEDGMPYQLWGSKDFKTGEEYPLVLALHGGGTRGGDEDWPVGTAATIWTKAELQEERPCFVVAPRCPEDQSWRGEYGDKAAALVKLLADSLPVDRDRIYVTGGSLGGGGSWYQISEHQDLYAGTVLMANGGPVGDLEKFKDFPIWQFHGELDADAPVDGARAMAEAMKQAGAPNYEYTELKGEPHSVGGKVYPDVKVQEWLFGQKRQD
jgi:predicted peptidase